eukprot:24247-Hanusia_phi.AAC.1
MQQEVRKDVQASNQGLQDIRGELAAMRQEMVALALGVDTCVAGSQSLNCTVVDQLNILRQEQSKLLGVTERMAERLAEWQPPQGQENIPNHQSLLNCLPGIVLV